jgi:hypothetical protein
MAAEMELRDDMRARLTHGNWTSLFRNGGRISEEGQRKRLLGLIRKNPRDYRGIYARVMEAPELAVSAEDAQAAALMYELADTKRENIQGLSPEKLRALADQNEVDEFAEQLRTGKAKFISEAEKRYIKQQNKQIKDLRETIDDLKASAKEDMTYLNRIAGKEFMTVFDRALKLKENIRRQSDKLERAVTRGRADAGKAARALSGLQNSYKAAESELEALARVHKLEIDVREALAEQRVQDVLTAQREVLKSAAQRAASAQKALDEAAMTAKTGEAQAKLQDLRREYRDYVKSAKTEATLTARLARRSAETKMRGYLKELYQKREAQKAETRAKKQIIKRIFRRPNPREVNHDQGQAIAYIQRLFKKSDIETVDQFINSAAAMDDALREIYDRFNIDADFRETMLRNTRAETKNRMEGILSKGKFDDISPFEKKFIMRRMSTNTAEDLGLYKVIDMMDKAFDKAEAEEAQRVVRRYLPDNVYYRIIEKPLKDWTLEEGDELAGIIDRIYVEGKAARKAAVDADNRRIDALRRGIARAAQNAVPARYREKPDDSPEKKKWKQEKRAALFNRYGVGGTAMADAKKRSARSPLFKWNDMDNARFAEYVLDNEKEDGVNKAVLVKRADEAYNKKMTNIDERMKTVTDVMKKNGAAVDALYKPAAVLDFGGDIGKHTFTVSEMIGTGLALKNKYSREAVETGNLLSAAERLQWRQGALTPDIARTMAQRRLKQLEDAAAAFFADPKNKKYAAVSDAIEADLNANGGRVNASLIEYNNNEMITQSNYYPMNRVEAVSSHASDAQELREMMGSAAGGFQMYIEKGFTKNRVKIPPEYQTAISLDAFKVWGSSVSAQEHFIAYGQLVKDANRIYKDPASAARIWIERRFGTDGVKRVNRIIDDFINPEAQKTKSALDETLSGIRRSYAAAVLGARVTPVVKQFLTSPGAFMAYMKPWEYWGAFVKYSMNRNGMWDEISALSPRMKHRSAGLIIEEAKQAAAYSYDKKGGALSRLSQKSMAGLELVDNLCVSPGWWVLYNKEMNRLSTAPETANMNVEERSVKARDYADDIIEKTQPSGRAEAVAPMFKGNNEAAKAVLQFQQSLNVIWQQTRYDLPAQIRRKKYKQTAGQIAGYAIAGLMVGLITEGFDDDDDDEAKNKKLAKWSASQYTDSVPLLGSLISDALDTALTGKQPWSRTGVDVAPVFTSAGTAVMNLTQALLNADGKKAAKGFVEAAKAASYLKGFPVHGTLDAARLFGYGDGDGKAAFRPETLLGRRQPRSIK